MDWVKYYVYGFLTAVFAKLQLRCGMLTGAYLDRWFSAREQLLQSYGDEFHNWTSAAAMEDRVVASVDTCNDFSHLEEWFYDNLPQ